ncbi:hypothetical protein CsSME_00004737 [Camellia sinensis var. sinensis]
MSNLPERAFFNAQFTLRLLSIALTSAAIVTMLHSHEALIIADIFVMEARYNYTSALRFILGADIVVCACSVLSLIFVFLLSGPRSNLQQSFFIVFLHDLAMAMLMMAGCGAATAISVVSRAGLSRVGWIPICGQVSKFCNKVALSVGFSYSIVVCYLLLTVMTVHNLKSKSPARQEGI